MDPYTGEVYATATYPSYDGNDYKAIAATDPVALHRPDRVGRLRAGLGVQDDDRGSRADERARSPARPGSRTTGTLRLDKGKTKIDDADRKGMGWMTFEDGVAYSRNVVAAKVALGLGKTTEESSAILYDMWLRLGYGQPTGIDVAGEVGGLVRDPGITDWRQIDLANGAFGQGVAVTPDPARDGLRGAGERRDARPAARRQVDRRPPDRPAAPRAEAVVDPSVSRHARPDDAARHHRGPVLPRPDARPGLRRRRQDGHRPDLGPEGQPRPRRLEAQPLQLLVRRLHRARRRACPDLVVAIQIEEGTPTVLQGRPHRDAGDVVRALPADRDRRHHDARPAARRGRRP